MKNYEIVRRRSIDGLENRVSDLLLKGWVPTGGIYMEQQIAPLPPVTLGSVYCQAMWRRHASPIQVIG